MVDYLFDRIIFYSKERVGKTAFSKKYCVSFPHSYKRALGFNIFKLKHDVKLQGDNTSLCFWDLSDRYYPARLILRDAQGGIIMYDITNKNSMSKIPDWIYRIKEYREDVPILLVGNKLDLEENREVSKKHAMMIKEEYNLSTFIEISVETGENVDKMLEVLVNLLTN